MKLLLLNDAGIPVACFDDFQQYAERSPAQTFALLDLVEKLIESVDATWEIPVGRMPPTTRTQSHPVRLQGRAERLWPRDADTRARHRNWPCSSGGVCWNPGQACGGWVNGGSARPLFMDRHQDGASDSKRNGRIHIRAKKKRKRKERLDA